MVPIRTRPASPSPIMVGRTIVGAKVITAKGSTIQIGVPNSGIVGVPVQVIAILGGVALSVMMPRAEIWHMEIQ